MKLSLAQSRYNNDAIAHIMTQFDGFGKKLSDEDTRIKIECEGSLHKFVQHAVLNVVHLCKRHGFRTYGEMFFHSIEM